MLGSRTLGFGRGRRYGRLFLAIAELLVDFGCTATVVGVRYAAGTFLAGMVTTMLFVDVTKLMVGRLRPDFLDICVVDETMCSSPDRLCDVDDACTQSDANLLRWARSVQAQIPLRRLSTKLPREESRGHKPFRHVEMFATKSVTSPRQTRLCRCNGI